MTNDTAVFKTISGGQNTVAGGSGGEESGER